MYATQVMRTIVAHWLVPTDIWSIQLQQYSADVLVLVLNGAFGPVPQLRPQALIVLRLAVGLTSQFRTEHVQVVGNYRVYLFNRPGIRHSFSAAFTEMVSAGAPACTLSAAPIPLFIPPTVLPPAGLRLPQSLPRGR